MAAKGNVPEPAENGAVSRLTPFQTLLRRMTELAVMEETQNRVSGEDINAILTAETEEEMWDADELSIYNAQKLSGCDLQTTWFEVRFGSGDSDIKTPFTTADGKQLYLLVHSFRITDATDKKDIILPPVGEEFTWNTSARNIVGKLFWMLDHGWFDPRSDRNVRFRIEGTKLTGGRSVEKIKEFKGTPLVTVSSEPPF